MSPTAKNALFWAFYAVLFCAFASYGVYEFNKRNPMPKVQTEIVNGAIVSTPACQFKDGTLVRAQEFPCYDDSSNTSIYGNGKG